MAVLSRAPAERQTIAVPTWDLWLTNLVTAVNEATAAAALPAAAGTLTGATLAANVLASSLTSVGTLLNLTVTNAITGSVTGAAGSVAASALTGTTLAAGVVTSSLTAVGTLLGLSVNGNLTITNGSPTIPSTGNYNFNSRGRLSTTADGAFSLFTAGGAAGTLALSTIDLQGGQLAFPATQNASAGANTLDDYEEGTWTPSLGGTTTYGAQTGTYTKVGRLVKVQGHITVTLIGTGSTGTITGAPFTAGSLTAGGVGYFGSAAANATFVACYINGTSIVLTSLTAAGTAMTNPATFFGNGTDVYFALVYAV